MRLWQVRSLSASVCEMGTQEYSLGVAVPSLCSVPAHSIAWGCVWLGNRAPGPVALGRHILHRAGCLAGSQEPSRWCPAGLDDLSGLQLGDHLLQRWSQGN